MKRGYQLDFSELHRDVMYDTEGRLQKARKTIAVLRDAMNRNGIDPARARLLDIGCSTGSHHELPSAPVRSTTALVASLGTPPDGRRVAWGHALYRLGGALLCLPLLGPLGHLVALLSQDPARQVAHAYTVLNVGTALVVRDAVLANGLRSLDAG